MRTALSGGDRMTDDDPVRKLGKSAEAAAGGVKRWGSFRIRVDLSDNGLLRLLLIQDPSTVHAVELNAEHADSLIEALDAQRAKMGDREKVPFRATHHQLHALATYLRKKSDGNKFSAEWQWGEVAMSAAEQIQEFKRLRDFLKQRESVERAISRILDGPK